MSNLSASVICIERDRGLDIGLDVGLITSPLTALPAYFYDDYPDLSVLAISCQLFTGFPFCFHWSFVRFVLGSGGPDPRPITKQTTIGPIFFVSFLLRVLVIALELVAVPTGDSSQPRPPRIRLPKIIRPSPHVVFFRFFICAGLYCCFTGIWRGFGGFLLSASLEPQRLATGDRAQR